jgi:hypothetical protein
MLEFDSTGGLKSAVDMIRSSGTSAKYGRRPRSLARALAALAIPMAAGAVLMSTAEPAAAGRQPAAHAARTLHGTATAHLHLVEAEGSQLTEEGPVSGALTGSARGDLHTGAVFTASFTIHTSAGSITGYGTAAPHGLGRYQSFSGSFRASSGSGRYAHISGRAGLYGVFDRRSESVVIQTTDGTLSY